MSELSRSLSLPVLVLYGLGTTIGAGIYALVGEVAGRAGMHAPLAFAAAGLLASFTALSFCELSARLPHAGGEAVYVGVGFDSSALARVVGLATGLAACLSAATVARGFVGYVSGLAALGDALWIVLLLLALGGVAAWGIRESAGLVGLLTLIEAGGLVVVIVACREGLASAPARIDELLPGVDPAAWVGIGSASLLCFYAFLGFEDMVNVAEEVREVRRTLPKAIVLTLAATLCLYLLLTSAAVLSLPPERLAASGAPIADLFASVTGRSAKPLLLVGVLAMLNGVLVQIIKATRIFYGLAKRGELPSRLARVHPARQTPMVATAVTVGIVAVFALALPIAPLARLTSGITLAVFAVANLALLRLKRLQPAPPDAPRIPTWVPGAGALVSAGLLAFEIARLAGGLAGGGGE